MPGWKQRHVAAELVDDDAFDARALGVREACERTDDLRKDAAAINIGDEHHGAIGSLREAHIRDVALAQVHFGRAAGTLDEHEVAFRAQPFERFEHRLQRGRFVGVIGAGVQIAACAAVHDDLRADIAVRLEQHGVHVRLRRDARRECLPRLRTADLAAIDGHGAVQRHVLRLERCDAFAGARGNSTKRADERALARIGTRSLNHQCAGHRGLPAVIGWAAPVAHGRASHCKARANGQHYVIGTCTYENARPSQPRYQADRAEFAEGHSMWQTQR